MINRKHTGPAQAICATCGLEIAAYESRRYGDDGAVHVWKPKAMIERAHCFSVENKHKYPNYYTDG